MSLTPGYAFTFSHCFIKSASHVGMTLYLLASSLHAHLSCDLLHREEWALLKHQTRCITKALDEGFFVASCNMVLPCFRRIYNNCCALSCMLQLPCQERCIVGVC